ncbi:MAG: polysaccharide biosynthesis C-terminal domain-containing protein [Rubrivivax sp.]|nr:polysaccharide biosynthesis C-terminal domain-containing protein [Rubrivivax sp.]
MRGLAGRIRRHLRDPDSRHRQVALGFLWVSLFVLMGKLAGAGKEMAVAWRFGVSAAVDAYVFVFNLISWPVAIWFGILGVVLLPLAARLRHDTPAELPRFRAELLGLTLAIGLALGLLAWWALPALLQAGWLGLSGAALTEALHMVGGLALLAPLGLVASLFSVWLLAAGHHRNTLFEAIPPLILLCALLLPWGAQPEALVWGTVAGAALQVAALAASLRLRGELSAPAVGHRSPVWPSLWGGIGIMALGQTLTTMTSLVDQFFAAGLGAGALATLSYANRILALVLGLGATAIGRATLPVFSDAQITGSAEVPSLALWWSMWMGALGLAVLLLGWLAAPWAVKLLFERGAFSAHDTLTVTTVLRYSLLQVPFYFASLVLVSALAAQKRHSLIALSGSMNLLLKIPLSLLLVDSLQLNGLVLATALMYAASAALLYSFVKRSRPERRHA